MRASDGKAKNLHDAPRDENLKYVYIHTNADVCTMKYEKFTSSYGSCEDFVGFLKCLALVIIRKFVCVLKCGVDLKFKFFPHSLLWSSLLPLLLENAHRKNINFSENLFAANDFCEGSCLVTFVRISFSTFKNL
jgi:hypothetical protein